MVDGVKQPLQIAQHIAAQGGVGDQIAVGRLAFFFRVVIGETIQQRGLHFVARPHFLLPAAGLPAAAQQIAFASGITHRLHPSQTSRGSGKAAGIRFVRSATPSGPVLRTAYRQRQAATIQSYARA